MCTLRQTSQVLSLDHVRARCPNYQTSSTPNYHTPVVCDTRKPDHELSQAIANYMFQNCGHWCVYSETTPGEKAWIWDQRGCWQKNDHCLTIQDERDHAISAKQKFCVDVKTAHELLEGGKSAGALQMIDRLINLNVAESSDETADLLAHKAVANARLGREDTARHDSNTAVGLSPENPLVYFLRARVRLTVGRVEEAQEDLQTTKDKIKAFTGSPLPVDLKTVSNLESQIKRANSDLEQAMNAYNNDIFVVAKSYFEKVRNVMPQGLTIRLYIAECELANSEHKADEILSEMTSILKRDPSNVHALVLRGKSYLYIGKLDLALNHFKEALRLDPDHPRCKKDFKLVRKMQTLNMDAEAHVNNNRPQEAMTAWKSLLDLKPPASYKKGVYLKLCRSSNVFKQHKQAEDYCNKVLELENNNVEALLGRGDARLAQDDYDKAIRDYEMAFNQPSGRTQQVEMKINDAKRMLKKSKTRDYYQILGVTRHATAKDIKSAYRKLALQFHPDKYQGDDKEGAEKKFQEIALAHEILSDPEKKSMVDRGEDPNEQQQGGGGGGGPGFPGARFNMNGRTFHFRFG